MRPVAIGRRNWIHIGSPQAGPKIAAILSVVESCRRLKLAVRDYLTAVSRTRRSADPAPSRPYSRCLGISTTHTINRPLYVGCIVLCQIGRGSPQPTSVVIFRCAVECAKRPVPLQPGFNAVGLCIAVNRRTQYLQFGMLIMHGSLHGSGFWRVRILMTMCFLSAHSPAKAHFLVTGNLKHFPASWRDTKVVTARQFLDALAEAQQ